MSKAENYIRENTKHFSNEWYDDLSQGFEPWLTPDQARKAVEIERGEMIERACEYLDLHCNDIKTEDNGIAGWIDNEFINNFRQAMKDE